MFIIFSLFINIVFSSQTSIVSIEPTRADYDAFNSLYTVYKMIDKKNKVKFDLIEKTKKTFKDSTLEPSAYPYLDHLFLILKSNNENILERCHQNFEDVKHLFFKNQLQNLCDEKLLQKIKTQNQTIDENIKNYFNQNLERITKSDSFTKTLDDKKTSSIIKNELKQLLTNHIIKNPTQINIKIIPYLDTNNEITKIIQLSNLDIQNINKEFSKELDSKIQAIITKADNEVDHDIINKDVLTLLKYFEANLSVFNNNESSRSLLYLGKSLNNRNCPAEAREVFSYLILHKNKFVFEKAHFEILWTFLKDQDYKKAFELAQKLKIDENLYKFKNSKIHFWMAFLYSHFNEKKKAISIFTDIVHKNPLAYYSIISSKKIIDLDAENEISAFYSKLKEDNSPIETSLLKDQDFDFLKRVSVWGRLGYISFLNNELRYLKLKKHDEKKKRQLYLNSALALSNIKNHLESFKIIYKGLSKKLFTLNSSVLNILYPQSYLDEILAYKEDIDPIIVISLMRQESAFNPNAMSSVGARGLMQLMPYTAKRILPGTNLRNITDTKRNIKAGVKYLTSLLKRYENNLVYTLAAYNAGENRVKRWRENLFKTDSTLHTIETIPFKETKQYVKLIFRNIFFYHMLLEKNNQIRNPETINTI